MSDPDAIRDDIESTRAELGYDVDALADKVRPSSIAHRQAEKVKSRFASVKESVMGSAHSSTNSVTDAGHTAVAKAKGNPLAVGLIVFGAGWLISSLIPASDAERDVAETAKEKAQPLVEKAKGAAQDAAQNLKEPAMEAVAAVKDRATDAASTVKDEAQGSASDLRESATDRQ